MCQQYTKCYGNEYLYGTLGLCHSQTLTRILFAYHHNHTLQQILVSTPKQSLSRSSILNFGLCLTHDLLLHGQSTPKTLLCVNVETVSNMVQICLKKLLLRLRVLLLNRSILKARIQKDRDRTLCMQETNLILFGVMKILAHNANFSENIIYRWRQHRTVILSSYHKNQYIEGFTVTVLLNFKPC